MEKEHWNEVGTAVIIFMQAFLDRAGLPLRVSKISDPVWRVLQKRFATAELDWDWAIQFTNKPRHFDLAVGMDLGNAVDGVAVGLYHLKEKRLEIQAVESFVKDQICHPLRGRLVELTVIAATYFVLLMEGREVHIIDPLDDTLIAYYTRFGFKMHRYFDETCLIRMTASIDVLEKQLLRRITNQSAN